MKSEKKVIVSITISIVLIIVVICSAITINSLNISKEETTSDIVTTYNVAESTTAETTTKPKLSNNYKILASGSEDNGDFYELVGEQKETVNNGGIKLGVIKNNKWLVEMTSNIPFVNEDGYLYIDTNYLSGGNYNLESKYWNAGVFFEYCGNGVFIDYYYYKNDQYHEYTYGVAYNSENKKSYSIDRKATCPLGLRYCTSDDTLMRYWDDNFMLRDCLAYRDNEYTSKLTVLDFDTMEIKETDDIKDFCQYSEGLLFVEYVASGKPCAFLDMNLEMAINLKDYNTSIWSGNFKWREDYGYNIFIDGKCEFVTHTQSGSSFRVTIDKTGKELSSIEVN